MTINILNKQHVKRLNRARIAAYVHAVCAHLRIAPEEISFVFCDNRFMRALNKQTFGCDNPTDVISYPYDGPNAYLGEAIISVEEAVYAAKKYHTTWRSELHLYIIHAILHMLDWDDTTPRLRARMEKKQTIILTHLANHGN